MIDRKAIEVLKREYKHGTRVKLEYMDDKWGVPYGTFGTVDYVDDIGNIHMKWDNGSGLALIYGVDKFWKVD